MSISIIFIHVNNFSIILICNEKTGIFFWYKLQYIEASGTEKDCARSFSYAAIQYKYIEYQ